jgi:hypothetical protein
MIPYLLLFFGSLIMCARIEMESIWILALHCTFDVPNIVVRQPGRVDGGSVARLIYANYNAKSIVKLYCCVHLLLLSTVAQNQDAAQV